MASVATSSTALFQVLKLDRPPRSRGFAPKTRTGCVPCKQARVKCDEGKPNCQRCAKRKGECCYKIPKAWIFQPKAEYVDNGTTPSQQGHEPQESHSGSVATKPCSALPATQTRADSTADEQFGRTRQKTRPASPSNATLQHVGLASDIRSSRFLSYFPNPEHAAALQYFLEVPAPQIAYNKECHFFTVTLPVAVSRHPELMQAMIALATLSAARRGTSTTRWTRHPPLVHYNRAISIMIRKKPPLHVTLLVCMLLWLYEQFQNDHPRALFHRESAMKLLSEWRSQELGTDRLMDEYIASSIEPTFLTGLKITGPVKVCREVLKRLQPRTDRHALIAKASTYEDTLDCLGACIDLLDCESGGGPIATGGDVYSRHAFLGLRKWDQQFQSYAGSDWTVEGPILLSYATTVAMLVESRLFVDKDWDDDRRYSVEFLLGETSKFRSEHGDESAHASLLKGVALIVS